MPDRSSQPQGQPTPVDQDAHATAAQLQQRAATDYTEAQARRDQLAREDRVNGQAGGQR